MDRKPGAVIPENLSEMSPVVAWNLALNTIAPIADYNSFWNDGLDTPIDIENLLVREKTITRKAIFRYLTGPRRITAGVNTHKKEGKIDA